MVERRVLPAAGLARLIGVLALLAGVVAMHSAVFGLAGHAAGAHTALTPTSVAASGERTIAATAAGHASGSPHRHATPPPTDGAASAPAPLPPHDPPHTDGTATAPDPLPPHDPPPTADAAIARDPLPPTDDVATAHNALSPHDPPPATHNAATARDPLPPHNPPSATHDATSAHNPLPPRDLPSPTAGSATAHNPLSPQDRVHRDNRSGAPVAASGDSSLARAIGLTVAARISRCADGGCDGGHSALHGCVFILVAAIVSAALVLLSRLAVDRPGGGAARPRHWRARRERPPPWTVLTLAELAILRI
ncbi:hypothetical protein AB0346_06450 [Nocardia beijingensis]|uniref:hypothetical protein n=1 Tax=Nocardia beijingensis TaxID=95162 RepID=UPI00344FDC6A